MWGVNVSGAMGMPRSLKYEVDDDADDDDSAVAADDYGDDDSDE